MLKAVKTMNSSQNKIPIVDSGEVKFVLAVVRSKASLKPATRQLERHPADIIKRNVFAEEVETPRAGSEGVRSLGPLVQPFRPRPPRSSEEQRKNARFLKSEVESRK